LNGSSFDARGGKGLRGFGHADANAAVTVRRPTRYFDSSARLDIPARASRRIAAYRSTFDMGGIDTALHPDQPMLPPHRVVSKLANTDFTHPRSAVTAHEQVVSQLPNETKPPFAFHLVVYDDRVEVARHERLMAKAGSRLDLDHYLEALVRKPGALPGATALEQARAAGRFTPVHDAWWAAVCKVHGDAAGTRALIEVLLLHRHMTHEHVVAGLATAVRAGALTADAVALEARKFAETDDQTPATTTPVQPLPANVVSLTQRRLAQLPPDTRPLPSVTAYDELLRRRPHRTAEGNGS
jgi:hypothetical protein